MSESKRGKYFIRVLLDSGTRFNPMGNEEVAVFYPCRSEEPSKVEMDKEKLLRWVNSNPACKKNQSNERYKISKQADAISLIFLTDREIQACQTADRIFSC